MGSSHQWDGYNTNLANHVHLKIVQQLQMRLLGKVAIDKLMLFGFLFYLNFGKVESLPPFILILDLFLFSYLKLVPALLLCTDGNSSPNSTLVRLGDLVSGKYFQLD